MDNPPPILRTCPSCGSAVEPGHKFCEVCGAKMPELPVCSNCGAQFLAPVKFCEMCGTPAAPQGPVQEAPAPGPATEPEPARPLAAEPPQPPVRSPPPPASGQVAGDDPLAPAFSGLADLPGQEKPKAAPAKTVSRTPLIVGGIVLLLILAAGAWFVGLPMLKGGIPGTGPAQPPVMATTEPMPATTLPATMPPLPDPATPVPTTKSSLAPEPTQVMPKNQEVFFNVEKDQVNAKISILFQRGPGENLISAADVKVTYPDGTVKTGTIRPSTGQTELIIQGTKGVDRVEVIARMHSGQTYRVKDDLLPFKEH